MQKIGYDDEDKQTAREKEGIGEELARTEFSSVSLSILTAAANSANADAATASVCDR